METREINQALRNNPKKFPQGYVIELNNTEKQELIKNFDWFNPLKHSTAAPHAFTEQGLYMLATILKGDLAISTTIAIIDTFTKPKNNFSPSNPCELKNKVVYLQAKLNNKKYCYENR